MTKTNKMGFVGKEVIPTGVRRASSDPELERMDYLVEGVAR
jgi:hypothetical protein